VNIELKKKLSDDIAEYVKQTHILPDSLKSKWDMFKKIMLDRTVEASRDRLLDYDGTSFALYISENDDTILKGMNQILKDLVEVDDLPIENQYLFKVSDYRVISGDTIEATLKLPFNLQITDKFRFYGIKPWGSGGKERLQDLKSKDFLEKTLGAAQDVRIQTLKDYKAGEYGGYLVVIWIYDKTTRINVNELMIKTGYTDNN